MVTEKIIRECIICEEFHKKYLKRHSNRRGVAKYIHKKTGLSQAVVKIRRSLYPKITGTEEFENYRNSTSLKNMLAIIRQKEEPKKYSPSSTKLYVELQKEVSTLKVDFQIMREEILDLRQIVKEIEQ